ncbi:MAG TPA: AMP-binding protein [Candidatus Aphodoplasma excrementigallinarum]|uniref:AMP-binding protein n=1 Tax=Candidatus Aphodoplasma excrementigallinarum TaxID=2840673 RepID=A0A9D1NI04_9FIRM|nr:AMP-binding protein [Candidatus Aphodoplasma excrementigallinarum]
MSLLVNKYAKTDFTSCEDYFENFHINVPENFNFAYDVIDELASTSPDKDALVWCNDEGEERTFSFAEMKKYSDLSAQFLKDQGLKKGDMVMLVLKRHYEFWWLILGMHKLGVVGIPATHLLMTKDIVYRCNAADIKMVIATADNDHILDCIDEAQAKCPTLTKKVFVDKSKKFSRDGWIDFHRELDHTDEHFVRPTGAEATQNNDIMLLYFTSGTSGMPKMVIHNFAYPLAHIATACFWQNIHKGGVHLTVADTGWAKTAWGKLYGQWLCEAAIFVYDYSDKFKPADLLHVIEKHRITTFCAPPTIYRFFIKEDLTKYDLSSLEYACVAGEPLNPEIYNQFYAATGLKLMEGFGQTELTITIANNIYMEPRPGSMGKPMPHYDVDIIDDEGNSCPPGKEGQIVLRATRDNPPAGMFMGYYRDDEMTNSVWHDGLYYTGDVAWKDEDGYYWFVGRADDVIKSSGYRIGPFEVESALMEHPAVLETAITAVPDELRGQVVKATIVLAKGYTPSEELKKELQNHVKHTTAPYKYPRIVEFVDELPKTISGKIRRVQIREEDKN